MTPRMMLSGTALLLVSALPAMAVEDVNLLAWCDHADAALFAPFEAANDAKVNVKSYELTGAAISLLEQSQPGDWDVFVVDSADVIRIGKAGWLAPLNKADFPYEDIFDGAETPNLHEADGQLWGVPEKFGFNTLSYDKTAFPEGAVPALADLFSPEMQGKVAVYDYYLPIIKTLGLMKGIKPTDFTAADLETIKPDLMALKGQSALVGDITTTQTALSQGEAAMLIGMAEWVASVQAARPNLGWNIPVEGGLRWSQSVAVFKDSSKPELSLKLAQYLLSPEAQGMLAKSPCYWAMPVNAKAVLSDADKAALNFDQIETFLANSYDYGAVDEDLDRQMLDLWTDFLAQ
jgi:spermidine/putrescine transport system substrate-binding protein